MNMMLRKLKADDAPRMLEWMKDPDINRFFQFDAAAVDLATVLAFIDAAQDFSTNRHYAVVDDTDTYVGTISLKGIDAKHQNAEYAVSMTKHAIGTGAALDATAALMHIAFDELNLHKVYLNVFSDNVRAIRFYEKFGFVREGLSKDQVFVRGAFRDLYWYGYFNPKEQ